MQVIRAVGPEAAAKKYDLLSAMMAHGLASDKHRQREIARLWCVDERTVKRDMARLRSLGWIELRAP